jgi:hypothetical protein
VAAPPFQPLSASMAAASAIIHQHPREGTNMLGAKLRGTDLSWPRPHGHCRKMVAPLWLPFFEACELCRRGGMAAPFG